MIDVTHKDSRYDDWEVVFVTENALPTYVYRDDRGLRVLVSDVEPGFHGRPNVCAVMVHLTETDGENECIAIEYGESDADAAFPLIEAFEAGEIDVPAVDVDDAEG